MDNQKLAEQICRQHLENMRQISHLGQTILAQGEDAVVISLYILERPVFAGDFIAKLGLTTGRIANILKKLEEKKLITRTSDREDRRRVHVSLTEAGRRHAEDKYQAMIRVHRELLDRLGAEDTRELMRILNRLEGFAEDVKPSA